MKMLSKVFVACVISLLMMPFMVEAGDGNWKKGRIYYRMVCTVCHKDQTGDTIPPSLKTKAEWVAYFDADSHASGKDKVSYYVSKEYRQSIKATNKAAAKFIKVPNAALIADIKAFVNHGSKDSDNPAGCK